MKHVPRHCSKCNFKKVESLINCIIGENGIKKDSEITLKSLIESSHFSNYDRKRKSYNKLFNELKQVKEEGIILIGNYKGNPIFRELL